MRMIGDNDLRRGVRHNECDLVCAQPPINRNQNGSQERDRTIYDDEFEIVVRQDNNAVGGADSCTSESFCEMFHTRMILGVANPSVFKYVRSFVRK